MPLILLSALFIPLDYSQLTVPIEVAPTYDFTSTTSVAIFIESQSRLNFVPVKRALAVSGGESHFIASSTGDMNIICPRTGKPVRARGIWQITECYHPEVSDEQAYDVASSTAWAMDRLGDDETCKQEWTQCRLYLSTP